MRWKAEIPLFHVVAAVEGEILIFGNKIVIEVITELYRDFDPEFYSEVNIFFQIDSSR